MSYVDVVGCLACDLTAGRRALPGGPIFDTDYWRVEHCIGPLGVGTLLVKPHRHVTRVAALTASEAAEQGWLLHMCAVVIDELLEPAQTYMCLWSHAGGEPVHIHHVVQPVTREQLQEHGLHGPRLQAEMFATGRLPVDAEVERFADQARAVIDRGSRAGHRPDVCPDAPSSIRKGRVLPRVCALSACPLRSDNERASRSWGVRRDV